MISLFPKSIALSIVPAVICLSELCGKRIAFLYVLLYLTILAVRSNHQIIIGCGVFIDFLVELHLVYTIVPLIWQQSLFYIPLFGCLHFFVIISILWLVYDEGVDMQNIFGPQLPFDESIRIFGYCILPYLSTVICSWYLCTVYGIEYLPYYLLVLSFAQYRVYITDPEIRNTKEAKYGAEVHLVIVALYFLAPLATFVVKHASMSGSPLALLELKLLLEFFFLVGLCGIGISFLGLQPLLKHYLPDASVMSLPSALARDPAGLIRDGSLVTAALLATPAMRAHGLRLHFYTGPPVALAALAAVLPARGGGRLGGVARAVVSAVAFGAQVTLFPWRVRYTLWDPSLMQRQFAGILLVTALAPVMLWLLARRDKAQQLLQSRGAGRWRFIPFTVAFTAFLTVFLYCEWNFYLLGHSPYHPVLLFSALIAAAIAKIPDSKLPPSVKRCLAALLLARCCLVLAHRLSGGHREVFPARDVACLWLLCLQAVCLLWRRPGWRGSDWLYASAGWASVAAVAASTAVLFGLLHALRHGLLAFLFDAAFDRRPDYAEFIVLCVLLCGALHSRSLAPAPTPLWAWTPAKLLTVACLAGSLSVGLLRNDILPYFESNIRASLACLQASLLGTLYALVWRHRERGAGGVSAGVVRISGAGATARGFALTALLTFLHSLLYCTLFDQPLASAQTVIALTAAACLSATFTLGLGSANPAVVLRPALALLACTILLSGAHLLALSVSWASFAAAAFALCHQLLICHRLRVDVRSNPDVVQLTHGLSDEERAFNALLAAAYALLLAGCWNPLENVISLALPLLALAWAGDKCRPVFLTCLLSSCQLAALYNVDFAGDEDGWWSRFVGFCEAALCLLQLPLHWILLTEAPPVGPDGTGSSAAVCLPGSTLIGCLRATASSTPTPPPPLPSEASDSDQLALFVALLVMPCPLVVLLLFASSWQAGCLCVASLLLGADFLAGYRGYLGDLVRSSFASLGDGRSR